MIPIVLTVASSLALLAPPPAPAPLPPRQDAEEEAQLPDERPEIEEMLDQLSEHVKAKGKEDEDAIKVIDDLYREFPNSGPKDRAAIVKGLEGCFKAKRKDNDEGLPDDRLYMAAAVAMRDMGPESVKPLMGLVNHKDFRKNLRLQEEIVVSLGKTKDEGAIKTLIGLLKHKDAELIAAASRALSEYREFELDTRKEIFEEILKVLMAHKSAVDADTTDPIASERYNTIAGDMISALQQLSSHDERIPEEWQRWWNKNKKEDWNEPGE
jgi:hypothetical protein